MKKGGSLHRTGGDLVVETLAALGVRTVFGIPGQHALALFDALGRSELRHVSSRIENNAAFAADGFARTTGGVGVLFLSTGPGALTSLAALQEAAATCVPVLVISSQIPSPGLGGRRRGMLHQLDDQKAAAANVTKGQRLVQHAAGIPAAIEDAWREAVSAPQGPSWIEIPQDVLLGPASVPVVADVRADPLPSPARAEVVQEAVRQLAEARRPAIVAGGGVRRGRAEPSLLSLAEQLRAPVVCSPGGKGAFPWEHELSLQSWVEDRFVTEVLDDADVLLVVGSSLGEITSNYFTLAPRGQVVQIDAELRVLESNGSALGIRADAAAALQDLDNGVRRSLAGAPGRPTPDWHGTSPETLVQQTLRKVQARLDAQDLGLERRFLADLRAAVPDTMDTFWDMTIAAYWAWSCWDPRRGQFHSGQGAGGLGFALPAAIGGAAGSGERVVAVSGDGSGLYSIAELAAAQQHQLPVTWLIIDDGGYGILREYMLESFGRTTAADLAGPDFAAVAVAFGIPARTVAPADIGPALGECLAGDGPNVVVVPATLKMFAPTHRRGAADAKAGTL